MAAGICSERRCALNAELKRIVKNWRATAAENLRVAKEEKKRFGKFSLSLEAYGTAMNRCARDLERFNPK